MSTLLDINLMPVTRYSGQEYPELLGLYASEPPRRAARSRGVDRLVLYLAMIGNAPFALGKQDEILAGLAKIYYATPGSVTSALKAVAEELNQILLERNRRVSEKGRQGLGLLTQFVVREQQLYLAQSGAAHAYWITEQGVQHFYDLDPSATGLGLVRAAPLHFSQVSYQPNGTLILAGLPAPGWGQQTWTGLQGQGPESIRRRLVGQTDGDLNILIVQARPGSGKIHVMQSRSLTAEEAPTIMMEPIHDIVKSPSTLAVTDEIILSAPNENPAQKVQDVGLAEVSGKNSLSEAQIDDFAVSDLPSPVTEEEGLPDFQPVPAATRQPKGPSRVGQAIRRVGRSLSQAMQRGFTLLGLALEKIFPEDLFRAIPSTLMAAMAIFNSHYCGNHRQCSIFPLGKRCAI